MISPFYLTTSQLTISISKIWCTLMYSPEITKWCKRVVLTITFFSSNCSTLIHCYILMQYTWVTVLKGNVSRDFRPTFFFLDSNPSGPLINRQKYFRIRVRFRREIRSQSSENSTLRCASHRRVKLHTAKSKSKSLLVSGWSKRDSRERSF